MARRLAAFLATLLLAVPAWGEPTPATEEGAVAEDARAGGRGEGEAAGDADADEDGADEDGADAEGLPDEGAAPVAADARAAGDDEAGPHDPALDKVTPLRVVPRTRLREAIRGGAVVNGSSDPNLEAMRRFEEEAFGPGSRAARRTASSATIRPASSRAGDRPAIDDPMPAAIAAPDPTPEEVRPDLPWLRGLKTGDVPVRWDARVIRYLEFYRDNPRGRGIMSSWLRAQGRYKAMILDALRRHTLPEDLLYLCMIESSYSPSETSRVGASGLWQFMPAGGRIYGLTQDYWVDDRNDPEKATEAALLHLRDLHERFGTWHLALAAYNAGYGAVLRSMAKYGTNDFWALLELESGLPWESSVYVPKFLAAAIVGRNRGAFGFDTIVPDPPFEFDRVTVPKSMELAAIARAAGTDMRVIRDLNPALKRNRTPPIADYPVRIPKGSRQQFLRAFPRLVAEADAYDVYVLRRGERFEDVARTHGVSTAKLRDLNGVDVISEVKGGTPLVVPRIDDAARAKNRVLAERDLYNSDLAPGAPDDALLVAVKDKDLRLPGRKRVFYRVVAGDALDEVAAALRVKPEALAAWNGLDPESRLQARMILVAFVEPRFDADAAGVALLDERRLAVVTTGSPEHLAAFESRKGRARVEVVARRGDTMHSIARRYGLSKYDLARINRRGYYTPLKPGEKLIVYKVVDRAKARKAGVLKKVKKAAKRSKRRGGESSRRRRR